MLEKAIFLVVVIFLGVLALEFAIRRKLVPALIFRRGWALSLRQVLDEPGLLLMVFGLFAAGSLAQDYLAGRSAVGTRGVAVASILWQAALSVLLALCAARFHLSIAAKVFADAGLTKMRLPSFRQIAGTVALVGGAVWLLGYAFAVLSNLLVLHSPGDLISTSAVTAALLGQIALAPFALIRPAIACGARRPVANGLRLALRRMPLLLGLIVLLALPPAILQFGLGLLQAVSGADLHVAAAACIVVFGMFQFLAYEAVTLMVLREAVQPEAEVHSVSGLRP